VLSVQVFLLGPEFQVLSLCWFVCRACIECTLIAFVLVVRVLHFCCRYAVVCHVDPSGVYMLCPAKDSFMV
jgi:hypothetical protein